MFVANIQASNYFHCHTFMVSTKGAAGNKMAAVSHKLTITQPRAFLTHFQLRLPSTD